MSVVACRKIKPLKFNELDTLVIFGEVFPGGYVEGLIEAARAQKMQVIYSTVGRRDVEGNLRKLNAEELSKQPRELINIPLEAGFDMEVCSSGIRPVDLCKDIKLKEWEQASLDKDLIKEARKKAQESFKKRSQQWLAELEKKLPNQGNILIMHTMAGGVPRSKILLPILNRVLKGSQKRFFSSETFWQTDLGQLCEKNFNEVTAQTYKHLLEVTAPLREKVKKQNREVFYSAYSYHGTEVLSGDQYHWQSYAPYLQGFAKLELEKISSEFASQQVRTCVFNVPEILTKSSAVFPGVEIPLYTILAALKKEGGKQAESISEHCLKKLQPQAFEKIAQITREYFENEAVKKQTVFEKWPQHNSPAHMDKMLLTSRTLADLHIDPKDSITGYLSQVLFKSCGNLILQEVNQTKLPICWLGHDVIASDVRARF